MSHLILIDANHVLYPAYFRLSRDMRNGGINGFTADLWRLVGKFSHATHFVVIGDGGGKPTWRHGIYSGYKANRPAKPAELKAQIAMIGDAVKAFGLPFVARADTEADDIVATYAHHWSNNPAMNALTTIVSNDKDLMQLINERIIMFDPREEKFVRAGEVKKKFGVRPDQMADYLALVGDASDNVPGVRSIGPVNAAALLAKYDSVDGIYANIQELSEKHQAAFEEALLWEGLPRSKMLVTLRRDLEGLPNPAGFLFRRDRDYSDLAAYCRGNGMGDLANRVQERWHQ